MHTFFCPCRWRHSTYLLEGARAYIKGHPQVGAQFLHVLLMKLNLYLVHQTSQI